MKKTKNIYVRWQDLFNKIEGLQADTHNRIHVEREVIPIIFIPGIMGSRLRRRQDKARIWDPDDAKFMVKYFGWKTVTAAERRALVIGSDFHPAYAEVDNHNRKHNSRFASKQDRSREQRGWGGVMWGSYGSFLVTLQQYRWPNPLNACFEFPVHAFGYNWVASNDDAGSDLAKYIEDTITSYRHGTYNSNGRNRHCEKVILVTHSMGGLVARSACELHKARGNVIGVVHGVQPTAGSPAAYWRMKAGFERPKGGPQREWWDWLRNPLKMSNYHLMGNMSAVTLGSNGEEVTSLLGNSPGGLELLPTTEYRDNSGRHAWLEYPTAKGHVQLPEEDPYREIYQLRDICYRMINPAWLNPYKPKQGSSDRSYPIPGSAWDRYCHYLEEVRLFHGRLGMKHHPETYQFYGSDLASPDRVVFTREPRRNLPRTADCHPALQFLNRGTYKTWVNKWESEVVGGYEPVAIVTLQPPSGNGDGTVPVSSASVLPVVKERTSKIGTNDAGWFDIGHQEILGTARAQAIVTTSIRNCVGNYIESKLGRKAALAT